MTRLKKLFMIYLKPHIGRICLVLVLLFLQTLANLFLPNLMSKIVDVGIGQSNKQFIYTTGCIMLVIAICGTVFVICSSFFSAKIALKFSHDLRHDIFVKVESFNLNEFNDIGTSSLITRSTNDVTQVQQVVLMALRMMVTAPLMIIGGVIMALVTNVELSIILIISIPILLLVIFFVGKRGIPLFKAIQSKIDKVNLVLRENLTGIRVDRKSVV